MLMSKTTDQAHHAQVLSVLVLADDVPQAVEGGARVLVDGDLLVRGGRFALACNKGGKRHSNVTTSAATIQKQQNKTLQDFVSVQC